MGIIAVLENTLYDLTIKSTRFTASFWKNQLNVLCFHDFTLEPISFQV